MLYRSTWMLNQIWSGNHFENQTKFGLCGGECLSFGCHQNGLRCQSKHFETSWLDRATSVSDDTNAFWKNSTRSIIRCADRSNLLHSIAININPNPFTPCFNISASTILIYSNPFTSSPSISFVAILEHITVTSLTITVTILTVHLPYKFWPKLRDMLVFVLVLLLVLLVHDQHDW